MNYLFEINAFDEWLENHDISSTARLLWYAIMQSSNKFGWMNPIQIPMSDLVRRTGLNKKTISIARKLLRESGLIDFKEMGSNRSTLYTIHSFESSEVWSKNGPQHDKESDSVWSKNGPQSSNKDFECGPKTDHSVVQNCTTVWSKNGPLYKQTKNIDIIRTDLESDEPSQQKKTRKKSSEVKEPESFITFYNEYPRHEQRKKALEAWLKIDPDADLAARIIESVKEHLLKWGKGDPKFIPLASSYLNGERWNDEFEKKEAKPLRQEDRPLFDYE